MPQPNKKPGRQKPPTVGQRRRADIKRAMGANQAGGQSAGLARPVDVRIDKAQALWRQQKYDDAIWQFERALARNPQNAILLVDVARAYALRYRYEDAEKLVDQACVLYPDDARLQCLLGESYVQIQQFDRAIACYRRSLELAPDSPQRLKILLDLAEMHERLHRLPAAREYTEQALVVDPNDCCARYLLAVIDRRSNETAKAEAAWRQLAEAKETPRSIAADAYYQVGALQDKRGEFDDAYESLLRAKKLNSGEATGDLEIAWAITRVAGKTIACMTAEYCERWIAAHRDLAPLPCRLALLTSHPRSGTTLLEQVLDSHPEATSADELQIMAEMVYAPLGEGARPDDSFPAVLDSRPLDRLEAVRSVYLKSMEGALRQSLGGKVLIDKNPELTMLLPLVARVFPEMKVLFALRDPRDVVISCFTQQLPLNPVSVHYLTLEGTVKKYVKMMQAWLKLRPMIGNAWIEVRYEDVVTDLEKEARRVLDFLDLPWDDRVLKYHQRAQTKHVHSPTYEAVTKPVYSSSIGRWRNYARYLEPYQELLQPFVSAFGYE